MNNDDLCEYYAKKLPRYATMHNFGWGADLTYSQKCEYVFYYLRSRGSDALERANARVIEEVLEKWNDTPCYDEKPMPSVVSIRANSWAVGWIDQYAVRILGDDGAYTDAFRELCSLMASLEDYPILNEHYFAEEEEADAPKCAECERTLLEEREREERGIRTYCAECAEKLDAEGEEE